jgi:hypothetical protein
MSLLESLPKEVEGGLPRLVDDLVSIVFDDNPARFLKAHNVPMEGAEQSVVFFEFDQEMFGLVFKTKYLAAMRTMNIEPQSVVAHGHLLSFS